MSETISALLASLPAHGGDLAAAAARYQIAQDQWLDLSTGINPCAYPVTQVPASAWQQLPYLHSDFFQAIADYYQNATVLASSGTQAVIQLLPALLNRRRRLPVLLPQVGYSEHAKHWQLARNPCHYYPAMQRDEMAVAIDKALAADPHQHLVVINPNNPTAVQIATQQLLAWADRLAGDALLIVDEAFIDTSPQSSLLAAGALPDKVLVLRSFGKFFGLAGLRVGFTFAAPTLLHQLQAQLGLWQINGPAQYLVGQALRDRAWQRAARVALQQQAAGSRQLCLQHLPLLRDAACCQTPYFCSYQLSLTSAAALYHACAEQAVLLRLIPVNEYQALVRIGTFASDDSSVCARLVERLGKLAFSGGLNESP